VSPFAHPTTRSNAMNALIDNSKTIVALIACYLVGYYGLTFLYWLTGQ